MATIKYAVQYGEQTVTDAEYDLIHWLYNIEVPQKITALKFARAQYGLGLREAKEVCDAIGAAARHSINW